MFCNFNEAPSFFKSRGFRFLFLIFFLSELFFRVYNFPVVSPNSGLMFFWNVILLLLSYFLFFKISVELNFDVDFRKFGYHMIILEAFSIFFFLFDIIIKFNLEFYEDGNSIKNRAKIMKYYLQTTFFSDFGSLLGLISSVYSEHAPFNYFPILFFLQYRNLGNVFNNIEQFMRLNAFEEVLEMALVLFKLVCITHLFACVWHSIAYYQYTSDSSSATWFQSINYVTPQSLWYERYLVAIYWSLTTLVTVGYGDITPKNLNEATFCSITLLCGTLVFGYCVNCVGQIMQKKEERERELKYLLFF